MDSDVSTQISTEGERVLRSISAKDWVMNQALPTREPKKQKILAVVSQAQSTISGVVLLTVPLSMHISMRFLRL